MLRPSLVDKKVKLVSRSDVDAVPTNSAEQSGWVLEDYRTDSDCSLTMAVHLFHAFKTVKDC
jgi:hypothetical protein